MDFSIQRDDKINFSFIDEKEFACAEKGEKNATANRVPYFHQDTHTGNKRIEKQRREQVNV